MLAVLAARGLYEEQPELWRLGESGRARTIEDFNHHFRALQSLNAAAFAAHVAYCENLFAARGFPKQWLDDAWRWMRTVIRRELPTPCAVATLAVMDAVPPGE